MASIKGNCSELASTGMKGCHLNFSLRLSPQQEYRLSIQQAQSLFYNFTQIKRDSVSQHLKDKRNYK